MTEKSHALGITVVFLVCLTVALLCLMAPNGIYNVSNDPLWQMIVSENLVRHHRLSVDNLDPDVLARLTYHISRSANGRIYYFFPFGTTLVMAPLVAVLDAFGWDMLRDEVLAERVACAVLAPVLVVMLFAIARRFLPALPEGSAVAVR